MKLTVYLFAISGLTFLLSFTAKGAALSGTYTICASGCSYSSFSAAVSDLTTNGVSGATTFNVDTGNYKEAISIGAITGASSTNTITFKGAGAGNTKIYNSLTGTMTAVVAITKAKHISFEDMTIAYDTTTAITGRYALYLYYSDSGSFKNCRIFTPKITTGLTVYPVYQYYCNYNTFSGNYIRGGYYAMYDYQVNYSTYTSNRIMSSQISIMYNYYGIKNVYDGNFADSCYGGSTPFVAYYETAATYKNNQTFGVNAYNAFYAYQPNYANQNDTFFVVNNLFNAQYNGTVRGMMIYFANGMLSIKHNTVRVKTPSTVSGFAMQLLSPNSTAKIDLRNNNFERNDTLNVVQFNAPTYYLKIEGNNYFNSQGTKTHLSFNSVSYSSFKAYKTAAAGYGLGITDTSQMSYFVSVDDLHYDASKINPYSKYCGIDYDKDGDIRSHTAPSTGGDEAIKKPISVFVANPDSACIGTKISFINKSVNTINYLWNFGNGDTSSLVSPGYTYTKAGTYMVTLYAYDSTGAKDSISKTVFIDTLAKASFSVTNNCVGFNSVFKNSTTGKVKSYFWEFGDGATSSATNPTHLYSKAGTYNVKLTVKNAGKCTATDSASLVVYPTSSSTQSKSICDGDSVIFGGKTLKQAGTYASWFTNHYGCDSLVTLKLSVNPKSYSSVSATICNGTSYLFGGKSLNKAGTYYNTLKNVNGCDSVITLTLKVNPTSTGIVNAAMCDGSTYTFGGKTLTQSGIYYNTVANQYGCDSVITLYLVVNYPTTSTKSAAICNGSSYSFGGMKLTQAGTYYDTIPNSVGCDSIITLTLKVNSATSSTITTSICKGSSYFFGGVKLFKTGTYYNKILNSNGCDSSITLNLSVNAINDTVTLSGTTLTSKETGATYQWLDCKANSLVLGETNQSFTPKLTGNYAAVISKNTCKDTSSCFNVFISGISDENSSVKPSVLVSPNPFENKLLVRIENASNLVNIKLINMLGVEVEHVILTDNKFLDIDTNNLSAGLYYLIVDNGKEILFRKGVVKE